MESLEAIISSLPEGGAQIDSYSLLVLSVGRCEDSRDGALS